MKPGKFNQLRLDLQDSRYVADRQGVLFAIDLATGDRTIVSGNSVGTGPDLNTATYVVLNAAEDTAFVSDESRLFSIDLASGNRRVVSGSTLLDNPAGSGADAGYFKNLTLNPAEDTAFVLSEDVNFSSTLLSYRSDNRTPDSRIRPFERNRDRSRGWY